MKAQAHLRVNQDVIDVLEKDGWVELQPYGREPEALEKYLFFTDSGDCLQVYEYRKRGDNFSFKVVPTPQEKLDEYLCAMLNASMEEVVKLKPELEDKVAECVAHCLPKASSERVQQLVAGMTTPGLEL